MIKLILIVEDKEDEQMKAFDEIKLLLSPDDEEEIWFRAKPFIQVGLKKAKTIVFFVSDMSMAEKRIDLLNKLSHLGQVGVITDLMFPREQDGKEEPNGLGVIASCIQSGFPVVVCSDTDHHDVNYLKPIFPLLGKAHPIGDIPVLLDKKDWKRAISLLMEKLNAL